MQEMVHIDQPNVITGSLEEESGSDSEDSRMEVEPEGREMAGQLSVKIEEGSGRELGILGNHQKQENHGSRILPGLSRRNQPRGHFNFSPVKLISDL